MESLVSYFIVGKNTEVQIEAGDLKISLKKSSVITNLND